MSQFLSGPYPSSYPSPTPPSSSPLVWFVLLLLPTFFYPPLIPHPQHAVSDPSIYLSRLLTGPSPGPALYHPAAAILGSRVSVPSPSPSPRLSYKSAPSLPVTVNERIASLFNQGSKKDEAKDMKDSKSKFWSGLGVAELVDWLTDIDNHNLLNAVRPSPGKKPGDIRKKIAEHDESTVKSKIQYARKQYLKAKDTMGSTGEGDSEDGKSRSSILEICPDYDRFHTVYSGSLSLNGPSPIQSTDAQVIDSDSDLEGIESDGSMGDTRSDEDTGNVPPNKGKRKDKGKEKVDEKKDSGSADWVDSIQRLCDLAATKNDRASSTPVDVQRQHGLLVAREEAFCRKEAAMSSRESSLCSREEALNKREALVVSKELELEKKKDKWEAKKKSWEAKKEDWEKDRLTLTMENTRLAAEISFIRSQQEK
ncbi:MAG: hypothetical protein J3Q66DRAFT_345088 [Benniella sp.]|nr:MAG: hypothetical protein J3Q66DRAFT_345088 [Benniella sp.]